MRTPLLTLLFVVVPLIGCGRAEPFEEPAPPGHARVDAPPPLEVKRLRLSANYLVNQGARLADQQVLTQSKTNARCGPIVVTDARGSVVEGDAARVDLRAMLSRHLLLFSETHSICELPDKVGSLAEVDASKCERFDQVAYLHVNSDPVESAAGTAAVVRTERDGDFKLRVVESGREGDSDYVELEYAPSSR